MEYLVVCRIGLTFKRARIKAHTKAGRQTLVFLVDYGLTDWVFKTDVYDMPDHFIATLPFQAIECGLGKSYYTLFANILVMVFGFHQNIF